MKITKITNDTPAHLRRQIYVGSQVDIENMDSIDFNYFKLIKKSLIYGLIPFSLFRSSKSLKKDINNCILEKPICCLIDDVVNDFNFPPYHPVRNTIYSCSDYDPTLYIPLADFHEYAFESKIASFKEMCSTLGAEYCTITHAEVDGIDITAKIKANIPVEKEVVGGSNDGAIHIKKGMSSKYSSTFPKPKFLIKEYKSNFMKSEPSWVTVQKNRLERGLENDKAEVNYIDEMGITADLALGYKKMGFSIGGTFKKIKRRKFTFEIQFWPIED